MSDVLAKQVAHVLVGFGAMGTPHMQQSTIIAVAAGFCAAITSIIAKLILKKRFLNRCTTHDVILLFFEQKVALFFVS
jgi:uncharacterized membrane protein YedE/YeeE